MKSEFTLEQYRSSHSKRRVGLMGGTFDPVHYGHLVVAEEVRATCELDDMVFIPAGEPPHKQGGIVTAAHHRLAMLELAIASNPHFSISLVDMDRPGHRTPPKRSSCCTNNGANTQNSTLSLAGIACKSSIPGTTRQVSLRNLPTLSPSIVQDIQQNRTFWHRQKHVYPRSNSTCSRCQPRNWKSPPQTCASASRKADL